jgi:peptide/nickel transport system ATP-binding protein
MSQEAATTITASDLARGLRQRPAGKPVLEVQDVVMHYRTKHGEVSAVDGISFTLHQGEALGLVGESGCGKTSVAMSLLGLLPENARIRSGKILLDGKDLVPLPEHEMRKHRWHDISMVFQGAMNAWNPVYRVGDQIHEALRTHFPGISKSEGRKRIVDLFDLVGLPPQMMDRYPHEFSGGMRQRAIIAMALSCNPRLIIADEPTTALDVIVQDRILKQLKKIQQDLGMAIIYISHDIAVIAEVSDRIGVMYAGKIVELGSTEDVFSRPRHPYSWLLLSSTPSILGPRRKLVALKGEPPNLLEPPPACRFHPRCPFATERCRQEEPPLDMYHKSGQQAACWHWDRVPAVGEEAAS